jgi:hypothetical protein
MPRITLDRAASHYARSLSVCVNLPGRAALDPLLTCSWWQSFDAA